jgi:hypothetical protein
MIQELFGQTLRVSGALRSGRRYVLYQGIVVYHAPASELLLGLIRYHRSLQRGIRKNPHGHRDFLISINAFSLDLNQGFLLQSAQYWID